MEKDKREGHALGRFELMCEAYLRGSEETKALILSFLDDNEKQTFLQGCGLYHLLTDMSFHRAASQALCEQLYNEFNAE
jgi:hypothetical protein